jgi:hypothetical protein
VPVSRRALAVSTLPALALAGALVGSTAADAVSYRSSATLTGAAEVPGPGDPDGSGTARVNVRVGLAQACFTIRVTGVEVPTAAHIHEGSATEAGPVVVSLTAPRNGVATGCTNADPALRPVLRDIGLHPRNYYVNVHSQAYPAGAVRGQLQ